MFGIMDLPLHLRDFGLSEGLSVRISGRSESIGGVKIFDKLKRFFQKKAEIQLGNPRTPIKLQPLPKLFLTDQLFSSSSDCDSDSSATDVLVVL